VKITKQYLVKVIKEELDKTLNEPLDERMFDKVKQAVGGKIDQHRARAKFKDNLDELADQFFHSANILNQYIVDKGSPSQSEKVQRIVDLRQGDLAWIDAMHEDPEDGQKYIEFILRYLDKAKLAFNGLYDLYNLAYPNQGGDLSVLYDWEGVSDYDLDDSDVRDRIGLFQDVKRSEEALKKKLAGLIS